MGSHLWEEIFVKYNTKYGQQTLIQYLASEEAQKRMREYYKDDTLTKFTDEEAYFYEDLFGATGVL